jgi:hypothetical protein
MPTYRRNSVPTGQGISAPSDVLQKKGASVELESADAPIAPKNNLLG